jgi:hypothetical protein
MREPWISGENALRERLSDMDQSAPNAPDVPLPPYAIAFLAHLRLLIGVPFGYLVPDPRMLPDESIRFFHLDRSWTDRLVDGVFAVGKIGTREQAHHQAAAAGIEAQLDEAEPGVRPLQRGLGTLEEPAATAEQDAGSPVTGLLLRSALVSGWPHMEICAYAQGSKLTLLRLERLAPSVLIALFAGVPDRISLEEPHHGVQFGGSGTARGEIAVLRRRADGKQSPPSDTVGGSTETQTPEFPMGFRDESLRVVEIAGLRRLLSYEADLRDPPRNVGDPTQLIGMPLQTGSAAFATELLQPPWRQVYSDEAEPQSGPHPIAISVSALAETFDAGALAASMRGEP